MHVAHIERKVFSLHERHFITMADGFSFEMSNELFHLIRDVTNIEGLGWTLEGNILGFDFRLHDEAGDIIAGIGRKFLSLHNRYVIDIFKPEYEHIVVAILITLQHMMSDRAAASSSSSSSSGSN